MTHAPEDVEVMARLVCDAWAEDPDEQWKEDKVAWQMPDNLELAGFMLDALQAKGWPLPWKARFHLEEAKQQAAEFGGDVASLSLKLEASQASEARLREALLEAYEALDRHLPDDSVTDTVSAALSDSAGNPVSAVIEAAREARKRPLSGDHYKALWDAVAALDTPSSPLRSPESAGKGVSGVTAGSGLTALSGREKGR